MSAYSPLDIHYSLYYATRLSFYDCVDVYIYLMYLHLYFVYVVSKEKTTSVIQEKQQKKARSAAAKAGIVGDT
jgi:hypothetical protein